MHLSTLSLLVTVPILGSANPLALSKGAASSIFRRDDLTCTAKIVKPPPQGFNCGTFGKLTNPAPLQSDVTTPTLQDCAILCKRSQAGKCISYGYNKGTQTCRLYKQTLNSQGYADKTSRNGFVYYNMRCFAVSCVCNEGEPTETSAIYNGGFECDLDRWRAVRTDPDSSFYVGTPAEGGSASFQVVNDAGTPQGGGVQARLIQQFTAPGSNDYQLGYSVLFSGEDQVVTASLSKSLTYPPVRASDGDLNTWRRVTADYYNDNNIVYNLTFAFSGMSAAADRIGLDSVQFIYTG